MIPKKEEPDLKDLIILEKLGSGLTVKQIAPEVGLKAPTVTWRIAWMKKKFQCKSIGELTKKSSLLKVIMTT